MANAELKQYLVRPSYALSGNVSDVSSVFRQAAAKLKPELEAVLAVHGGKIIVDGSGCGIAGNVDEKSRVIVVETTAEGSAAIEKELKVPVIENKTLIYRPNGPIV